LSSSPNVAMPDTSSVRGSALVSTVTSSPTASSATSATDRSTTTSESDAGADPSTSRNGFSDSTSLHAAPAGMPPLVMSSIGSPSRPSTWA
jgi:hypothetical protein